MGFSNQSIAPIDPLKPHICKREGLWRVSPLKWKNSHVYSKRELWALAHEYANRQNNLIREEAEAAKERQREWKRQQEELELLRKEYDADQCAQMSGQWVNK